MPAKINFKALTTAADFKAAATSIAKRNLATKSDMQSALVCALVHMDTHGDYTSSMIPLIEVAGSFGKNLEVALFEWVLKFSWLGYTDKKWAKDPTKAIDVEAAKAQSWWLMERAAKAKPFDFQKAVEDLFTKITDELARPETILDRNTVFSAIETKMSDIIPVEDQIETLFARLRSDHDRNAVLGALTNTLVPALVQTEEREVISA